MTEIEQQENTTLRYRISKITTTKFFSIDIDEEEANLIFEENQSSLELNVGMGISLEKSEIFLEVSSVLRHRETQEIVIEHVGKTVFSVLGLKNTYREEGQTFDLPDGFVVQLYTLAYSHSRALLATELSKTVFKDKLFLPVIDPKKIIQK